jgi:hypothetical protein
MAEVVHPEKQHKKKRREKDDEDGSKKKKKKKSKRHTEKAAAFPLESLPPVEESIPLKRPPSVSPPPSPRPVYVASGTPLRQPQQQEQPHQEDAQVVDVEQDVPPPPSIGPIRTTAELVVEQITEKMERMRDRYRHGTLHLVSVFQFIRADIGGHGFVSFVVPTSHAFHDTLIEYFNNQQRHPAESLRLAQNVGERRSLEPHELAAYIGSIVVPEDTPGVWSALISDSKP